jgi:hypothetical protein
MKRQGSNSRRIFFSRFIGRRVRQPLPSFPRKRESSLCAIPCPAADLNARFHGHDGVLFPSQCIHSLQHRFRRPSGILRHSFCEPSGPEAVSPLPLRERVRVRGLRQLRSPSPHSSPVKGEEVKNNTSGQGSARRRSGRSIFDGLMSAGIVLIVAAIVFAGCTKKGPPLSDAEVKAVLEKSLPSTVEDKVWEQAPLHTAKLILQDMVEPRLMQASTPFIDVQSVTDGRQIAFLLSWSDATMDDVPGPGRFGDAVAVQLPAATTPDVPAPQMGEEGKPVEITYWSAIFQAAVNGRKDDIQAIYPRAKVDHYPFEAPSLTPGSAEQQAMAKRYAPARGLGNSMAGPRTVPVQDLMAAGPGTLQAAEKTVSNGSGKHAQGRWSVLLIRPLPNGAQAGGRSQVAFAVWEGSHQEAGARKMRTAWVPLAFGSTK